MGYWGKVIGGMAGFAIGGPFGAVVGAALGHAADAGTVPRFRLPSGREPGLAASARVASLFGQRDQVFAVTVVFLAARLAKCDGPVNRAEIDAFKRQFRMPPEAARGIGRMFDEARESSDPVEPYAKQLAIAFAESRGVLNDVLVALFAIARADNPVNVTERAFLMSVHRALGLDRTAWDRAEGVRPRQPRTTDEEDPYLVLGVTRTTSAEELRATWKQLVRENHPDSLAARGVPEAFVAKASDKVARINAAWDRIKRERGL